MRKWTWTTSKQHTLARLQHARSSPCRYTSLAVCSAIRCRSASTTTEASPPAGNAGLTRSHLDEGRKLRSRHLLRAILRECTYLPDSIARRWSRQHALERFRTYDFKSWEHRDDADFDLRLRSKEKEARSWLAYLKRANEGERKCLMRVLFMAYGRIGKRRHELMLPLLVKAAKDETSKHATDSQAIDNDWSDVEDEVPARGVRVALHTSDVLKVEPPLTPPLRALLQSQIRASPPTLSRPNPRRVTGTVAALNAWLRPMPQKRVENMRQKHYAELLNRMIPPLPTDEWHRLHDLATGRAEIERMRRRRSNPSQHMHRNPSLEAVVAFGKAPMKLLETNNGHAITPRYMRRLYAQVFSQCPLLDWDVASSSWRVTWGEEALREGVIKPLPLQGASP